MGVVVDVVVVDAYIVCVFVCATTHGSMYTCVCVCVCVLVSFFALPRFYPRMPSDSEEQWDSSGGDDDHDLDNVSVARATDELAVILIELKQRGVLSAQIVCVISYCCSKAGMGGAIEDLAFRPDTKSTGHFSRHCDRVVGTKTRDGVEFYELPTPSFPRGCERQLHDVSVLPAHEAFAEEFAANPDLPRLLEDWKTSDKLPPCYHDRSEVYSHRQCARHLDVLRTDGHSPPSDGVS
jgi:hypothetical protein